LSKMYSYGIRKVKARAAMAPLIPPNAGDTAASDSSDEPLCRPSMNPSVPTERRCRRRRTPQYRCCRARGRPDDGRRSECGCDGGWYARARLLVFGTRLAIVIGTKAVKERQHTHNGRHHQPACVWQQERARAAARTGSTNEGLQPRAKETTHPSSPTECAALTGAEKGEIEGHLFAKVLAHQPQRLPVAEGRKAPPLHSGVSGPMRQRGVQRGWLICARRRRTSS
jgi:hypothetical protein